MEWANNWHAEFRKEQASRMVTYRRGSDTVDVAASIGRTEHQFIDEHGIVRIWQSRDYLILTEDLIIGGIQVEPAAGDVIEDTDINGDPINYKVMPMDEEASRYSDKYGKRLRVYTKRID